MKTDEATGSRMGRQGLFCRLAEVGILADVRRMLMLGWTTTTSREDAERLARGLVAARLAACVQGEGPLVSFYVWDGLEESAAEFRLLVKFIPERSREVESWLQAHHPYATPEWIVLRADSVSEKYLSWARANSTSAPL